MNSMNMFDDDDEEEENEKDVNPERDASELDPMAANMAKILG
jgi:hypothetical protein